MPVQEQVFCTKLIQVQQRVRSKCLKATAHTPLSHTCSSSCVKHSSQSIWAQMASTVQSMGKNITHKLSMGKKGKHSSQRNERKSQAQLTKHGKKCHAQLTEHLGTNVKHS